MNGETFEYWRGEMSRLKAIRHEYWRDAVRAYDEGDDRWAMHVEQALAVNSTFHRARRKMEEAGRRERAAKRA